MNDNQKLVIRLEEQLSIYKDSANVQATYIDLARIVEVLLEIIKDKNKIGFKDEGGK